MPASRALAVALALSAPFSSLADLPLCREAFPNRNDRWRNCRIEIGGLAIQGAAAFTQALGPTFQDFLTSRFNDSYGLEFTAIPLNFDQNFELVSANKLDFIYSNPAAYTCLMVEFSLRTTASLMNFRKGNALDQFAGVIFTLANSSFNTVEQLREARVEAVSISGLGAMQLQQAELLSMGLNIITDVKRLTFAYNQNKIVQDVYSGYADVGFVRTDMIDRSVAKGTTKWEYFKVINEFADASFPFKRSTMFTPEWPIGCLRHVPNEIAELVGQALMSLDRDSPDPTLSAPGIAGSFQTWVPPMNYLGLLGMLEDIRYYDPKARRCLRNKDVEAAVSCPDGYVKRGEKMFCETDCKAGYTCLCSPCAKLRDPELVLEGIPLETHWPGRVDIAAVANQTHFQASCARMGECGRFAVGQRVGWRLLDNIGRVNRLAINAPVIESVQILLDFAGHWEAMTPENITVEGMETQRYSFNRTAVGSGAHIIQLRVNGEQISLSPTVATHFDTPLRVVACPPGQEADEFTGACAPCPPGSVGATLGSDAVRSCVPCSPGTYQPEPGQTECFPCAEGHNASQAGATACEACLPGSSTRGKTGAKHCDRCEPGQAASEPGMGRCASCERGKFMGREGASECQPCSGGMTTKDKNSVNESACGCTTGQYLARPDGGGAPQCKSCPEPGTHCPGFGSPPLVSAGFYMDPAAPNDAWELDVWKCISERSCPGQSHANDQICNSVLTGRNCALCEEGYTRVGSICSECRGFGSAAMVLIVLGLFFGSGSITYACAWRDAVANKPISDNVLGPVTVALTLMFFQTLAMFGGLQSNWPSKFRSVLESSTVVLLDFDAARIPCVWGESLAASYIGPLLVPVVGMAAFASWGPLSKLLHRLSDGRFREFKHGHICNAFCLVLQAGYIALAHSIVSIIDCYENPNEMRTVRKKPYATCSGGAYTALMPVFVLAFIVYIAGLLALFSWMAFVAPSRFTDPSFRALVHFLVYKFQPRTWWFGVLLLIRSTLVTMVTVIEPDDGHIQFCLMTLIFVVGLILHLVFKPYADKFSNGLETLELSLLIAILVLGASYATVASESNDRKGVGVALIVCFVLCILSLFAGVVVAGVRIAFKDRISQRLDESVAHLLPKLRTAGIFFVESSDEYLERVLSAGSVLDREQLMEAIQYVILESTGICSASIMSRRLPLVTQKVEHLPSDEFEERVTSNDFRRHMSRSVGRHDRRLNSNSSDNSNGSGWMLRRSKSLYASGSATSSQPSILSATRKAAAAAGSAVLGKDSVVDEESDDELVMKQGTDEQTGLPSEDGTSSRAPLTPQEEPQHFGQCHALPGCMGSTMDDEASSTVWAPAPLEHVEPPQEFAGGAWAPAPLENVEPPEAVRPQMSVRTMSTTSHKERIFVS